MKTNNTELYKNRLSKFEAELKQLTLKNRMVSLYRLLIFLLAVALSFYLKQFGITMVLLTCFVLLVPFLLLVKVNVKNQLTIKHLKALIKINKNELEAQKGNISVFYDGKEFIDPSHPYSFDLDIFGQASIYQLINRTCTGGGAKSLANSLKNNLLDKEEIEQRQQAIKEVSEVLDWRQNFQATGNIVMEAEQAPSSKVSLFQANNRHYSNDARFHDEILEWLNEPFLFSNKKTLKLLVNILPPISVILLGLTIAGYLSVGVFVIYGLVQLSIAGNYMKKIGEVQGKIGRKVSLLNKYESLLTLIEGQKFESEVLCTSKKRLLTKDGLASKALKQLKSLVKALDNRNNVLFAFIANAYFSWDIKVVLKMEQWRKEKLEKLPVWLDVIYEFDALSSFGTFSFNHPKYNFPSIKEGAFYLGMHEAGHPLINDKVRVDNDLTIDGHQQLLVVTGANMAGKSTFLRTVGVNMILAMAGSVVCAKEVTISPISMHTSVRTSDSVQKNESYFFAELKRLKSIIDRMQNGEKLFIIIDEMLRGTNSKDKHHGSEALIEQLIRLDGSGLIATHDIALGQLAEKYQKNVTNYRFEVEIENNELVFDYKLKTGVSQNLNATFLMRKMGITV